MSGWAFSSSCGIFASHRTHFDFLVARARVRLKNSSQTVETAADKFVGLTRRAGAELARLDDPDPTTVRHLHDLHALREHLKRAGLATLAVAGDHDLLRRSKRTLSPAPSTSSSGEPREAVDTPLPRRAGFTIVDLCSITHRRQAGRIFIIIDAGRVAKAIRAEARAAVGVRRDVENDVVGMRSISARYDAERSQMVKVENVANAPGDEMIGTRGIAAHADGADFFAAVTI